MATATGIAAATFDRFDQWGNFAGTVKVCRY